MDEARLLEDLRVLGLIGPNEGAEFVPLPGGVSADVFVARAAGGGEWVLKRSIPRLRVAANWRAPIARWQIEAKWLEFARGVDPHLAPEVVAVLPADNLIVSRRIDAPVWKQELIAGRVEPAFAADVGRALARLHSASREGADIAARFPDPANFLALRIEPFLLYVAGKHADMASRLCAMAADLTERRETLIWGDASPKNILVSPAGPVFIDAETAAMGDPAFDVAFCLTHLLLKTIWLAGRADRLLACFVALRDAYGAGFAVDADFKRRAAALVGALLLARVDGKSPAGYLDSAQEEAVRARSRAILVRPDLDLDALPAFWTG